MVLQAGEWVPGGIHPLWPSPLALEPRHSGLHQAIGKYQHESKSDGVGQSNHLHRNICRIPNISGLINVKEGWELSYMASYT